jgi:Lar family restriction alleviation protein
MSEKTQMQDLKPCPFCGGKAEIRMVDAPEYTAQCTKCHAQGPSVRYRSAVASAWNTRATATPTEGEGVRTIARRITRELRKGCGDNSCYFRQSQRGGMGTNGGCRCHERVAEILLTRTPQPTATPTEGKERKNHGPEWLGNATREVLHAMLDEHAEKVAKEISEFVRSAAELDERTRTPQPTDAASKGHWCVNCDVCETCRLSECACPEPTDAARAEAHRKEG